MKEQILFDQCKGKTIDSLSLDSSRGGDLFVSFTDNTFLNVHLHSGDDYPYLTDARGSVMVVYEHGKILEKLGILQKGEYENIEKEWLAKRSEEHEDWERKKLAELIGKYGLPESNQS